MSIIALLLAKFRRRTSATRLDPRQYIVQVRTRTLSGGWTAWTAWADWEGPLNSVEANEWLKLRRDCSSRWIEHRLIMIPQKLVQPDGDDNGRK